MLLINLIVTRVSSKKVPRLVQSRAVFCCFISIILKRLFNYCLLRRLMGSVYNRHNDLAEVCVTHFVPNTSQNKRLTT